MILSPEFPSFQPFSIFWRVAIQSFSFTEALQLEGWFPPLDVRLHVFAYGSKTMLVKRTFSQTGRRGLYWGGVGGVGWGGAGVLTFCLMRTVDVATLQRSLVSLLRYMLLSCRGLWYPCYVTCCYAAEISGILATLHVAKLQRSLESLLRYMLLRCRDLWYPSYATCRYAAEISGILAPLHVATLQTSLVSLLRYMLLRCRDLCYVMLFAKMWQWRFINKYKKLLEKTAEMLRKIEWKKGCLNLSDRNREENCV